MLVSRYLHTMVRVSDLEASLKFYRDALGLQVLNRHDVTQGRFTLMYLAAPGDSQAQIDRKSTRLNSSHIPLSRMPSSA